MTTCSRTPNKPQICSYCLYAATSVAYYAGVVPNVESSTGQVALGVVYGVLLVVLGVSYVRTAGVDPADPTMLDFRTKGTTPSNIAEALYCHSCSSYVGDTAQHCKLCNRYSLSYSRYFSDH